MMSPRSAPWRKLLGSGPGLAGDTEGPASADRDRTGDIGSGRSRSAATAIPQRSVSLGEVDRSAGPAGSDTGAGRVPYTGWPESPHAADVGSRDPKRLFVGLIGRMDGRMDPKHDFTHELHQRGK